MPRSARRDCDYLWEICLETLPGTVWRSHTNVVSIGDVDITVGHVQPLRARCERFCA